MKRKEANHDRHCVNLWGVVVFIFLCKKKHGNPITRKSDCQWMGFVICMHDFFDQIRELRTNESPKLDLCAQKCEWVIRTENVWNSSSQIESLHLKAHLRRPYVYDFFHCYGLNQTVWRHLLQTPCLGMIFSIIWTDPKYLKVHLCVHHGFPFCHAVVFR